MRRPLGSGPNATRAQNARTSASRPRPARGVPEPGGTVTAVTIERLAARALLLAGRSVLLLQGRDPGRPDAGTWWIAPGGGIEPGETAEAALVREVSEETGLRLDPDQMGPVVATRLAEFEFDHRRYRQAESFFAVSLDEQFEPVQCGWDDLERRALVDHRWWPLTDLAATTETVYPSELSEVAVTVLDTDLREPLRLGNVWRPGSEG